MEKVFIYEVDKEKEDIKDKLLEIVRNILDQNEIDVSDKSVLVKPNMLGAFDPERGATTDPLLIEAIVEVLEERKVAEIYVGDSPGGAEKGTEGTAKKCGIYAASKGHFLNFSKVAAVIPIKSRFVNHVSVPKTLLNVDIVINVPKLKTHGFMGFSACVKNMFGIIIGPYKAKLHFRAPSIEQFGELLVDIFEIREPDLNIIDGMVVMEGDGPTSGPTRKENMIISGRNGVVVDEIVAEILSFDINEVKYLAAAKKRNIGEWDRNNIKVIGTLRKIDNLKKPVTYSRSDEELADGEIRNIKLSKGGLQVFADIGRMVPEFTRRESCIKCGICAYNCPAKAIVMKEYPEINYKKCISCYCCTELCHENCYDIWDTGSKMDDMFKGFMS